MKMKELLVTIDGEQAYCIGKVSWNTKYYSFDDCKTWFRSKREGFADAKVRGVLDKPYNLTVKQ